MAAGLYTSVTLPGGLRPTVFCLVGECGWVGEGDARSARWHITNIHRLKAQVVQPRDPRAAEAVSRRPNLAHALLVSGQVCGEDE